MLKLRKNNIFAINGEKEKPLTANIDERGTFLSARFAGNDNTEHAIHKYK